MGKKSRRKRELKKWFKIGKPEEIISRGPLSIERFGRHIRISNTSTPEQHEAFLKRSEEVHKKTIEDLEREVPALQKLISRHNPVMLMHRAAYMLLPLFIKRKSESEYSSDESHYLPAVEYIQYLIAKTPVNADGGEPTEPEWDEIWAKTTEVIDLTQAYILTRKTLASPPSEIDQLRFVLDSQRLAIRVDRQPYFLLDFLRTSLTPYEQWIKQIYGIDPEDIINGLKKIDDYQKSGVLGRYQDVMDAQAAMAEKMKKKGFKIDAKATPEEMEQTRKAIESADFKADHAELQEKMRLTFTPAIFDITDLTLLPKQILSLLSVRPGESILTSLTGPNHDDLSPLSTSVLHYKPFLEVDGRYFTFYHSGFQDHIAEIIESDLFQKCPNQISAMAKRRSDRLETESLKLLACIVHPDFYLQNVYYPNPDVGGGLTELDIILGVDDILFLAEVKSGGFSDGAVRGAPKEVEKNLSDLIVEGQRQSERAERYIKSADEVAFFDETGKNIIFKIKHPNFRKIFRIVITREQLGWVGAQIAILSVLDQSLSKSFPWHVSIDDLRIFAEIFKDDEIRFVHFLEQRLLASAETTMNQKDEIDHIGLYNQMNHYHKLPVKGADFVIFDSSYTHDIDHYFMEKTKGGSPKVPTQSMPAKMREFIIALKNARLPGRFEAGSIILSMDAPSRDKFEQGLDALDSGKGAGRIRTFRLPFKETSFGISVTYADDQHWNEELIRSAAQMQQSGCVRWPVVRLLNNSPYTIDKIEIIIPGKFSDAELAPGKLHLEEMAEQTIATQKPGRNDPCPCGSGKKYKRCHGF